MASPEQNLQQLQAIYAQLLVNIADAEAQGGPNITVGGVSVDRVGYLNGLYERLEKLQKIPGVAQQPVYTITRVAR